MATITFKGTPFQTNGDLPGNGASVPEFKLIRNNLSEVSLSAFAGKKKILNIFPSVDTGVCAMSIRKFNQEASSLQGIEILNISADLPFAQKRFCGAEGINNSETLSCFRSTFAKDYGVEIADGPLAGLCARAVLVLDERNKVIFKELVPEIGHEPDYASALRAIKEAPQLSKNRGAFSRNAPRFI